MQENEPVLLVLSAYDREIILEKGEILCEKRQIMTQETGYRCFCDTIKVIVKFYHQDREHSVMLSGSEASEWDMTTWQPRCFAPVQHDMVFPV